MLNINANQVFKISIKGADLAVVLKALNELPFKEVSRIISGFEREIIAQLPKKEEEKREEVDNSTKKPKS